VSADALPAVATGSLTPSPDRTLPPATTTPVTPAAVSPAATPSTRSHVAVTSKSVRVLNNSTIGGLASRAGSVLADRGWTVTATGNAQGRLATSTVFYAHGQRSQARLLARQFPAVGAVRPNAAAPATVTTGHGLTLVVTRGWRS
jgi:hypothetical protein